jgi:hypothetical protein
MHCARKLTSDPSATGTYIHAICSAGTRLNIVREAKLRKAEDARRRLHQSALNRFKCGSRAIYFFSHSAQHINMTSPSGWMLTIFCDIATWAGCGP